MFLYNLTLQAPTAINAAILGHFSGQKYQELVVARQQYLELWRPDTTTGKLVLEHSENLFCRVRSLAQFRLTGGSKDHVALGADTGTLTLLEYDPNKRRFVAVQAHDYGRTGLRRQIPGQYIAADPRGRAVMLAGTERAKIVYVVTRDSEANLMLQSPLEANKTHCICFDVTGVDVGYENPVFAAIECIYDDSQALAKVDKQLVYYELDLGLNHVVRKWSTAVSDTANKLIALPGSQDGPSGVLVCSEGFIEYKHWADAASTHRVPIPSRTNQLDSRGVMIIASAVHRMKNAFFILAQAETGDLFKITVQYTSDAVTRVGIKYFDTIAPSSAISILRAGFLFAAAQEGGNHQLYQFENLGDEIESPEFFSDSNTEAAQFAAHELSSLVLVDEVESLSVMLRSTVANLAEEETPQIYALCGRGARSSLKIIRHGLEVSELAVSELPGTPSAIWAIRRGGEHDELIVVSFTDATLVLAVGEEVEEVTDSGLLATAPTLALHRIDGGGLVQVTPRAVRHVMPDGRVNEWVPPQTREIACAAANARQVAVSLARTGGHTIYFELHPQLGVLREFEEPLRVGSDVTCLALSPVEEGRRNAAFLAAGCEDQTVRVFALDASRCLEPLSMQAVAETASSVAIVHQQQSLVLYMGLRNGLLMRANVDVQSGELDSTRTRFLGARAVQLCSALVRGESVVVALSTAPWLCHVHQGRLRVTPLSYDPLDFASGFVSEQCPEGLVCVAGNTLRILTVDRPDASFNHAAIPLSLTPRDFLLNPQSRHFVIIESEHAHYLPSQYKQALLARGLVADGQAADDAVLPPEQFGLPRSHADGWASLIRVLDPFTGESTQIIELDQDTAAVSLAQVVFGDTAYIAVGCANEMTLRPRKCRDASIRLYKWTGDGTGLELVHVTPVEDIPQCLVQFGGLLLVSLGGNLRLYDMGIKRLLKKTQTAVSPHLIVSIRPHPHVPHQRLYIADVQESVRLVTFNSNTYTFHTAVDDTLPRYITAQHVLDDGDTVVAGDKFGNVFTVRVPERVSKLLDADLTGARLIYEKPKFGSVHKWDLITEFHTGDIITSLTTCSLAPGGRQVILYSTLLGSLQVSVPFVSKSDLEFFRSLEAAIRKLWTPVSGRDHLAYRSAISPVRSVVDGDLCELFFTLDDDKREQISDEVDRTQQDIFKKLEDIRSMFAF
ncbi:pre-mRNA-splicing factor rse1 [Coemansia sp. RSA 2336]|nr:pre-mRNA-splicing factor rse1 [Coemansia sp. RSA 2336]